MDGTPTNGAQRKPPEGVDAQPHAPPAHRPPLSQRVAEWCAAENPDLRCGTGPLARYVYMLKLAVRGFVRLLRSLRH